MNEEYNESGGLLGGKGFYIALMLCVSIIALSAWMIVNNDGGEDAEQAAATMTPDLQYAVSDWEEPVPTQVILPEVPDVAEIAVPEVTQVPVAEVIAEPDPTPAAVETIRLEDRSYVWPVVGETGMGYSMDALVYNRTMGDWRTHDGIDIAAQVGEYVRAASAGTVTDVYEDVLYGTTVVIDHGQGLVSYYANLQAQPVVKAGDELLAGDVIGGVGETALCESGEPCHLHFAMSLNDESVDPGAYLPPL